jgi:Cu-processing system ATP-binding protein
MIETSMLPAEPVISLRGVHKHYGPLHAVDGVDLDILPGEVFGLIGHNGAGKSTLFKMMLGLIPPTAGTLHVAGAEVQGRDFRAARRRIGYLPENVVLWDNLSGLETLRFFARLKGVDAAECAPLLERVGLSHAGERPVRAYSKGMRQRLGFAQALLGRPQVLFLDEPTTGLDPSAIRDFYATLRGLRAEGVTMILTSHVLAELQERVDRLAILASGRVQALGSVQALREQRDLPLRVRVQAHAGALDGLGEALRRLAGAQDVRVQGDVVTLALPRERKLALIDLVSDYRGLVRDVSVTEPSLEDLFFGLGASDPTQEAA